MNSASILGLDDAAARGQKEPLRVIGIDLGTTNSSVAELVWDPAHPNVLDVRCLEIEQRTEAGHMVSPFVPSAVALREGEEWIGEGAKRLRARTGELKLEMNRDLFFECKNDIGSRKTYEKAPEGYRSAAEISGKVLSFLLHASEVNSDLLIAKTVVTVPASFQVAQRSDTLRAAGLAGITLSPGALLDEPLAAFLDCLLSNASLLGDLPANSRNLMVFDFGGGTCDVAVFRVRAAHERQSVEVSPMAVSRYHRLGGGDIDRAIVYEILVPQLREQNHLGEFELSYSDKKEIIEPGLLSVAESLKIGLCNEIIRLRAFGRTDIPDTSSVRKTQPGLYKCQVGERELRLQSPSITLAQFDALLEPFLDQDFLFARVTEYRQTCSIFAPIVDTLDRAGLHARQVDLCVLVGGSSLIPQVSSAVQACFNQARLVTFPDQESTQLAVARGAAYQALALALCGHGPIQMTTADRIAIRTNQGSMPLLPRGALLPYPETGGWADYRDLTAPDGATLGELSLRIELLAGDEGDERSLLTKCWDIPAPVTQGDPLLLQYRMDENQTLEFKLTLPNRPDVAGFEAQLENPITNVVNPNETRVKIDEMEEELRRGTVTREHRPHHMAEIARSYASLQQLDKAISHLEHALRLSNRPDSYILHLMGIYHGERGDFEREEKCYREAHATAGDYGPLFNLALSQYRRHLFSVAKLTVEQGLNIEASGPCLTLAAKISEAVGDTKGKRAYLRQARSAFAALGALDTLDDWGLGWLSSECRMRGDSEGLNAAEAERQRRQRGGGGEDPGGLLPEVRQ